MPTRTEIEYGEYLDRKRKIDCSKITGANWFGSTEIREYWVKVSVTAQWVGVSIGAKKSLLRKLINREEQFYGLVEETISEKIDITVSGSCCRDENSDQSLHRQIWQNH